MTERNAMAELAKRLRNGLYINQNDKRFDGPVIVRTLEANDVLTAHRIIAELAKVRVSSFGDIRTANIADAERAVMKCIDIAEEGAGDGK